MAVSRVSDKPNVDWSVTVTPTAGGGWSMPNHDAQLCLLADIRRELQTLNRLLGCYNFTSLPQVIKRIDKRLATRLLLNGERPKARRRPKAEQS